LVGHAQAAPNDPDTDAEAAGWHSLWLTWAYGDALDGTKPTFSLAEIEPPGRRAWDAPPVPRLPAG
jgi:hypothetical protein